MHGFQASMRLVAVLLTVLLAISMGFGIELRQAFADEPEDRPVMTGGDVILESVAAENPSEDPPRRPAMSGGDVVLEGIDSSSAGRVANSVKDIPLAHMREDGSLAADGLMYSIRDDSLALIGFDGTVPAGSLHVPAMLSVDGRNVPVVAVDMLEGQYAGEVTMLSLPQTISNIQVATLGAAFPNLTAVEIDGEASSAVPIVAGTASLQAAYSSSGGMIYAPATVEVQVDEGVSETVECKELVWAPPALVVARMPVECRAIAERAFVDARALETVITFGTMERIAGNAFTDEQIASVTIVVPASTPAVVSNEGDRINANMALMKETRQKERRQAWYEVGFTLDDIVMGKPFGSLTETVAVASDGAIESTDARLISYPGMHRKATDVKHPDENGIIDMADNGLAFTHLSDLTLSVSWQGDKTATPSHVDIPAFVTIDDVKYLVTEIAPRAFEGAVFLSSVTIPEGVTRIGESAFESCANLTDINFPSGIRSIDHAAFRGTNVRMPTFSTSVAIGGEAFAAIDDAIGNPSPLSDHTARHDSSAADATGGLLDSYGIGSPLAAPTFSELQPYFYRTCTGPGSTTLPIEPPSSTASWPDMTYSGTRYSIRTYYIDGPVLQVHYYDNYASNGNENWVIHIDASKRTLTSDVTYPNVYWEVDGTRVDKRSQTKFTSADISFHAVQIPKYDVVFSASDCVTSTNVSYNGESYWLEDNMSKTYSMKIGDTVSLDHVRTYDGYVGGWKITNGSGSLSSGGVYNNGIFVCDSGQAAVEAYARPCKFTVTFDANGGSGNGPAGAGEHTYDGAWKIPENTYNPPSAGYKFNHWSTAKNDIGDASNPGKWYKPGDTYVPSSDNATLKLYAIWERMPAHEISFVKNGNVNTATITTKGLSTCPDSTYSVPVTIQMHEGDTLSLGIISVPDGYHGAWQTSGDTTSTIRNKTYTAGTASETVTASASGNKFTVSYDSNGGSGAGPSDVGTKTYDGTWTLPVDANYDPPRSDMVFSGWEVFDPMAYEHKTYKPGAVFVPWSSPIEVTFKAVWEPRHISVAVQLLDTSGSETMLWGQDEGGYSAGSGGSAVDASSFSTGSKVKFVNTGNCDARLAELRVFDAGASDLFGVTEADDVFSLSKDGVVKKFGFTGGNYAERIVDMGNDFKIPVGEDGVVLDYGCDFTATDIKRENVATSDSPAYTAPLVKIVYVFAPAD